MSMKQVLDKVVGPADIAVETGVKNCNELCRKDFNNNALVMVLRWSASLNTSFIYGGLALLQNLNDIELVICLKWYLWAANWFARIRFILYGPYYSNSDRIVFILFWSIFNFDFNLLFKLGYQGEKA